MRSDMPTVRENSRQRGPVRRTDLRQVAIEHQSDFKDRAIDAGYQQSPDEPSLLIRARASPVTTRRGYPIVQSPSCTFLSRLDLRDALSNGGTKF
jgi:hypothetical protein